jgi:hypothetical protein
VLTFLLVCYVCGTERVVERLPYEPRFEQHRRDSPLEARTHRPRRAIGAVVVGSLMHSIKTEADAPAEPTSEPQLARS